MSSDHLQEIWITASEPSSTQSPTSHASGLSRSCGESESSSSTSRPDAIFHSPCCLIITNVYRVAAEGWSSLVDTTRRPSSIASVGPTIQTESAVMVDVAPGNFSKKRPEDVS